MCVKIFKGQQELHYNPNGDFITQVSNSDKILVSYQPNDKEVEAFVKDMENCIKCGINPNIELSVDYGQFLEGYKIKKQLNKTIDAINLNEIIKLLVVSQINTDKKLKEISDICQRENG